MLRDVKEESGNDASGVRTLCPAKWTVRAELLASIIANYLLIMKAFNHYGKLP